ncbi:hypothetical protein B0A48_10224 [Cryoendolithus antarcticus]|uniref:Fungal N-terminal domain-containing protein n=1 Tax=Cryoendolithus antarcticus TaxID=1507870 RepID=A0A1V8SWY0_9PEZI|nr:hypothetical protein B0A48_10224 [Cryoendolithus antarcticus]
MALSPSVGDILMLSQTAWKIGRAFTKGRGSAPREFAEVERESDGLSQALKLVAETLHADGSILAAADQETQEAVATILDSANTTLSDLESFVERYSAVEKKTGIRTWSEVVIANYKTVQWTQSKGSITELRDMLQMHTNTINLTMQALQSRSLSRLERIAVPMAEKVDSIHDSVNGESGIGKKVDELHALIMAFANSTPSLVARERQGRNSAASSSTISTLESQRGKPREIEAAPMRLAIPPPRLSSNGTIAVSSAQDQRRMREDSAYYSLDQPGKPKDWTFESESPPSNRSSVGGAAAAPQESTVVAGPSTWLGTPDMPPNSRRTSNIARRESSTLPFLLAMSSSGDTRAGSSDERLPAVEDSPISPRSVNRAAQSRGNSTLPSPAMSPNTSPDRRPATPSSIMLPARARTSTNAGKRPSKAPTNGQNRNSAPGVPTFEKSLFRNAAILCDTRYKVVEYAEHDPAAIDPRFDTKMVPATTEGRICVIRKRERLPHGGTQTATSVWVISDDGEVRCQQKLPDGVETIPLCSYFDTDKVMLPSHTAGKDVTLRFHGTQWEDPIEKEAHTNWVNYVLESDEAAATFQSAIFERRLLGSFATLKTTVIHDGFKGTFALEEQMVNIDVLRIWEEDGSNIAGGTGGVMALVHYASNFSDGWARWWMNSSRQPVRLKEDDVKHVKLKGIDIPYPKPGGGLARAPTSNGDIARRTSDIQGKKKGAEKRITGVRIEFRDLDERIKFMAMMKRLQERMLPLPDI